MVSYAYYRERVVAGRSGQSPGHAPLLSAHAYYSRMCVKAEQIFLLREMHDKAAQNSESV
jgi:hypothetical protein